MTTLVMSGYALLATRLRRWLRDLRAMRAQNRFFRRRWALARASSWRPRPGTETRHTSPPTAITIFNDLECSA